jgi:threonine/homoserine/homoserine lactone efflux protein
MVPMLSLETAAALAAYAFVMSVTPGPINIMLLTSGANFGFVRTLPQVFGVTLGFSTVIVATGAGVLAILTAVPALGIALKIGGCLYMLYLALRLAMSVSTISTDDKARPLSFIEIAAFQWINPKAWIAAGSAVALYGNAADPWVSLAAITGIVAVVNLPSIAVWAGFGSVLKGVLAKENVARWFNIAMAVLLVASLVPVLLE